MRLVFFGSADFAIPAMEALKDSIVLVVSQPDQPTGRKLKMRATPVKTRALELGLPVETPDRCRDPQFIEQIRALDADVHLVAAYGQIMPLELLESARHGSINLHGSILPKWRGAAPIQRAIEAGDKETGITLMQMDEGLDTGDIIAIETVQIGPDETAGELFDRLAELAGNMAYEWMPRIADGSAAKTAQDDDQAVYAKKIKPSDTHLDFEMDAEDAYRRHRAVTPFPGSSLQTSLGRIKIKRARMAESCQAAPGIVDQVKPDLVVGFRSGGLMLSEVQPEGRKPVSGADFANGARLKPGDCLKSEER